LSREEQEAFAVRSQQRAAAAAKAGHFKDEIVPIAANGGSVDATAACGRTRPRRPSRN